MVCMRGDHRATSEVSEGRARAASWSFDHVVETVDGTEGEWLRTELVKVLIELARWARHDMDSVDGSQRQEDRAA